VTADQLVLLFVGLVVIAAVAVTVAYATAHARRRDARPGRDALLWPGLRDHDDLMAAAADRAAIPPSAWPDAREGAADSEQGRTAAATATATQRATANLVSPTSVRQVARVVAFLFLAAAAVVVALTRAWPDTEPAVFTLLAVGMLLVVLSMDLVPPSALGRWRRPAEAVGAIIFLGLLMALTGAASSPFFVGFFLVVAGTALSTEGRAPLAIALLASATLALVGIVGAIDAPLDPVAVAWIGFDAVALILLADIATAAARAQRHARDEALRASRFDALTGLYNRGFFFTMMEQEIRRSERMDRGFTVLMLDLDDLKPVNDRFGHQWGDRLLRATAETIRRTIRFTDAAARYGGDEFVILLPETDAPGGYVVGEKLRKDIADVALHAADRIVRSSVSVGLVNYPDDGTTIEQLVAAADVAMYEAKRRGKNRIVGYQTRLERVATAIEVEVGGAPAPLLPPDGVRTGGDPAPWGATAASVGTEPPLPRTMRATDVPPAGPPGPGEGSASRDRAPSAGATTLPNDDEAEQPRASAEASRPTGQAAEPATGPDADVTWSTVVSGADSPWLTRMDGPMAEPSAGSEAPGSAGRPTSTRDPKYWSGQIERPLDRPWIVLPIEPDEPPGRPA
jgi:diguanylate cyclase (GGDEF)-like protein